MVEYFQFLSKKLHMNKNDINYEQNISTLIFAFRGTNRGVHAHFHAG